MKRICIPAMLLCSCHSLWESECRTEATVRGVEWKATKGGNVCYQRCPDGTWAPMWSPPGCSGRAN